MELSEKIAKIIASIDFRKTPIVIAICEAADLGKTHLAIQLVNSINNLGISANHITLDSYLMARKKRLELGVSGYEAKAYDLTAIEIFLAGFLRGLPIEFYTYDHSKGIAKVTKNTIQPCSLLVVDGLHVMHERFESLVNYSILNCLKKYIHYSFPGQLFTYFYTLLI